MGNLPHAAVAAILCLTASFLTEVTSNTAVTSLMLPVVFEMVMSADSTFLASQARQAGQAGQAGDVG